MKLSDFSTLTFDCYGTLIDWESGLIQALEPLTRRIAGELSHEQILAAHGEAETHQQQVNPAMAYADVLAAVYRRLAQQWGVSVTQQACEVYGQSVADWEPFDDSVAALDYLSNHYRLVILSNVDNALFAASNRKLGVKFDAVFTAQDIGSYKPDTRNFHYMLDNLGRLGVTQDQILHTAQSLFHDHQPASQLGLKSCWINRRLGLTGSGATPELKDPPQVHFKFPSMAALAAAHQAETSGIA